MKKIILFIFILVGSNLYGQNRINKLKIGISFEHYSNVEEKQLLRHFPGYYEKSFDPGFELMYNRNLKGGFYIGTGLNYQ